MSRHRRFAGRYSYIFSAWWTEAEVKALTLEERHVYLCLRTGALSTASGIFLVNMDAIIRDYTAADFTPTREQMWAVLDRLRSKPNPRDALIDHDGVVLWVRWHLAGDPAKLSDDSKKGINFELARLPRGSRVVRRFRIHYKELLMQAPTPAHGKAPTPGPLPGGLPGPLPGTRDRDRERNRNLEREGESERERDQTRPPRPPSPAAPDGAPAGSSTVGENGSTSGSPTYDAIRARVASEHPGMSDQELDAMALRETLAVVASRRV